MLLQIMLIFGILCYRQIGRNLKIVTKKISLHCATANIN